MLHNRTDEVSRLSIRFALTLTSTWSSQMMFKWSDLGRLREYFLSDHNVACLGAPWASTISDRLEYVVAGLDKISK